MELTEKTLDSRRVFDGKLLHLDVDTITLPNGRQSIREVVRHPGGVCVLPLHADGTVSVVRQLRYPYQEVVTELPAGKLEPGEDPFDAIRRELSEETGYTAGEWHDMGLFYPTPGYTDERLHLYFARDLTAGATHPDEDEFIEADRVPLRDLLDQVMAGELKDGKTIALILKVQRFLELEQRAEQGR